MKLLGWTWISNWRQALRMNSVQAAALLAFLSMLQANVLPQVQSLVPPNLWPWVTGTLALAIVLLRLRDQPGLRADDAADAPPADTQ